MTRASAPQPWSAPLAIGDVPETGRSITLAADERTRAAIAEIAGLRSLPRLEATFDVALRGPEGLHVGGRVSATVGQTCVATLEPIESEVVEDIDLVFAPDAAPVIVEEDGDQVEIAALDAPEPFSGDVDLGAIATEFLLLGIDPYPRKPGAVFEPPAASADTDGPFAALKALRKTSGGPS